MINKNDLVRVLSDSWDKRGKDFVGQIAKVTTIHHLDNNTRLVCLDFDEKHKGYWFEEHELELIYEN